MADETSINLNRKRQELILPVGEADFAQFVAGLLGKPQTIENTFEGPFDLEARDIENCFHIVNQRVTQQNLASLIQFSVRIVYDDNSSVLLNSLDDFLSYREVRPVTSIAVHLSWTYVITFQDKTVPEKQVIDLSISTRALPLMHFDPINEIILRRLRTYRSDFFLRIQHTARSWGTDMENLLAGQVRSWVRTETGIKRFIYEYSGWIGFAVGVLFFCLVSFGVLTATSPSVEAFKYNAQAALSGIANDKLNFLINSIINNPLERHGNFIAATFIANFILSGIIVGIISTLADNPPKSYLVLSESAKKSRERELRERSWTWGYFVGSAVASTLAGVASRYIFAALF